MNLVVLSPQTGAPTTSEGFEECVESNETDWPCLYPTALNANFLGTGTDGAICVDEANEDSCVRFAYGANVDRAELDADPPSNTDCQYLLERGDSAEYEQTFDEWKEALKEAAWACDDVRVFNPYMANIYVMNNPFSEEGDTSFDATEDTLLPVNFIDQDRLPDPTDVELDFGSAGGEHEMGHAYGLGHTCDEVVPTDETNRDQSTNIMQTGAAECCCESAVEQEHDTGDYWASTPICNNCSVESKAPSDCNGVWDDYADCTDTDWFKVGDRDEAFTDDYLSEWDAAASGQLEQILDSAYLQCSDVCVELNKYANLRFQIPTEMPCHGGAGRVAFVPVNRRDSDSDGDGFMQLVPVVISGDHLGRLSWITSVSVVSWGDATRLVAPTREAGWSFSSGDPDLLDVTNLQLFDANRTSSTFPVGAVGTGYLWATDGMAMSEETFAWPVVDLVWQCNNDYTAPDVVSVPRPGGAYRLKSLDVAGDWKQELLIRPDYGRMTAWVEARGYPRAATTVALTAVAGGKYTWTFDFAGFEVTGWLKPVGTPVGSKLRVHIDDGSYGSWSIADHTLPDLAKLP